MKKLLSSILVALFVFSLNLSAQTITGNWKTIDDETGDAKSEVAIWKAEDGMYYGKIMKIYDETKKDNSCTKCDPEDARYNQKIIGMKIVMNLQKTGKNEWSKGTILDPNNGKVYKCKMWVEGNDLKLRGYIGPFYRTQTWHPIK